MKTIKLNNTDIPYQITKKNNKNTYFYFKRSGYIQINLSKYQTEVDALIHMEKNAHLFQSKYNELTNIEPVNKNIYPFLGTNYKLELSDTTEIILDPDANICYTPTLDKTHILFKTIEKQTMLELLDNLQSKYLNNPYLDITNITLKTRYTNTRHGSCNKTKRNININLNLIKYNPKYIEYVFCHEIAHLVHANHSYKFYDLLEKLYPNYVTVRQELKRIYR